jgi:hypothetical protein
MIASDTRYYKEFGCRNGNGITSQGIFPAQPNSRFPRFCWSGFLDHPINVSVFGSSRGLTVIPIMNDIQ